MTIIYRVILLLVILLIVKNMYKENKVLNNIMGGMVLIPMILRLLMIK